MAPDEAISFSSWFPAKQSTDIYNPPLLYGASASWTRFILPRKSKRDPTKDGAMSFLYTGIIAADDICVPLDHFYSPLDGVVAIFQHDMRFVSLAFAYSFQEGQVLNLDSDMSDEITFSLLPTLEVNKIGHGALENFG